MIRIRLEQPADYRAVEALTRDAFWNLHQPGCDEHYLTHILRDDPDFLPELDFVAELDGQIVGNIIFSRARVVGGDGAEFHTILFGPLSVLPEYQRKGVGGALVRHSLEAARQQGHKSVFIYGDPAYYGRFGFVSVRGQGISEADGTLNTALQAVELVPGALDGVGGRLLESGSFYALPPEKVEAFDRLFPPREKIEETQSQLEFAALVERMKA